MFDIYLDEDAGSREVMTGLALFGCDVVYSQDLGFISVPDEDHLARATQMGRVMYSCNVHDFARLHWEWMATDRHHAGIIAVTAQQMGQKAQLRGLRMLLREFTAEQMADRLVYLSDWR